MCSRFVVQLMINLLKILCANTPWQRRKLGKILNDWSVFRVQVIPSMIMKSYYKVLSLNWNCINYSSLSSICKLADLCSFIWQMGITVGQAMQQDTSRTPKNGVGLLPSLCLQRCQVHLIKPLSESS